MQVLNRRSAEAEVYESGHLDAAVEPPLCREGKGFSAKREKCFREREPDPSNG